MTLHINTEYHERQSHQKYFWKMLSYGHVFFSFQLYSQLRHFSKRKNEQREKAYRMKSRGNQAQVWKSSLPVESYREHAIPPATDKACEEPPSTRDHGPRVYRERLMLAPSAQQTPKFQTLGRRVAFQDKLYSVYKQLRGSDPLLHLGESFTSV